MSFLERERDYVRTFFSAFDWVRYEEPSVRNAIAVPLRSARVALVSTAGAYVTGQERFSDGDDGDAGSRTIPSGARVRFAHSGYDTGRAYRDRDVVFPLATLHGLAADGEIGEVAPRAFSFMGYIPETTELLADTAPRVARELIADSVDLALLVPA